jgi:hypothetical protein
LLTATTQNFSVQLGPFAEHMGKRGLATFTYTQGEHEVDPPAGWEHYFGSRPLYRFLDSSENDAFEALRRVRQLPRGLTPEATLRLFENKDVDAVVSEDFKSQFRAALERIRKVIDDDPEIDAILGYSEGAMLAASILYEEHENWVKHKVPRRIKASHTVPSRTLRLSRHRQLIVMCLCSSASSSPARLP